MPQSFDRIIIHTIFSTKYRQPLINESIEPELHKVICSEYAKYDCKVLAIGGTEDHVHIVHTLPRTIAISKILNAVKSVSSGWIRTKGPDYEWFGWQDGYGVFSADYRNLDALLDYVRNQRKAHAKKAANLSFRTEYTKILKKFGFLDINPTHQFPTPPKGWGKGRRIA
ncbi:IS200/IS605 family transposase [Neolewinella aurantiaca]|uniref:IS200/IS605 family transposase n=1 Tax=Neolewinella aurantiaca TaxID=2602767 RepID=A0A5C7FS01_9BACT|nr:IS200/IS605 family transposase [Neolewinella aurantiaca]TXF90800.1 IS200/IS605 family transposase [Neolewinella aurantiaca]